MSEDAVQGGASGAIVVEGIESMQPEVAGLPQRLLIVRDQTVAGNPEPRAGVPAGDLTLNYVPIAYPALTPAVIRTAAGTLEFWRVLNASADAILDIEVDYDGVPQTLLLAGVDGVPVGSQDGAHPGATIPVTHYHLPAASRVEFLIRTPPAAVRKAQLLTRSVNTGPDGDNDPRRVLANIEAGPAAYGTMTRSDAATPRPSARFAGLETEPVTAVRRLYFSQVESGREKEFFITVDGQAPRKFSDTDPPAIVTTQGSVEDWTIENRSRENHIFHIHQIHFLVRSQDNFEVNGSRPVEALQGQLVDTIDIPYWDGNPAHPYPRVTLRVDFRGPVTGDFPFHCHILEHEDGGMMAVIRVLPRAENRISSNPLE
jgi:FtsP/CotA-like multicopper oxidase with cupredoxin domain